jgi:hypothetical protein
VGLNWAREGLEFVKISVVEFAWRVRGSMENWCGAERIEEGEEIEERREEEGAGELEW